MVQEDQNQICGNGTNGSGSGSKSSSSKKLKQKKVPQRGLGVATLEMLREKEEQEKDGSNSINNGISSPSNTLSRTHSSSVAASVPPFPNYPLNKSQLKPNSVPFGGPSPSPKLSSSTVIRNCSMTDIENILLGHVPSSNPANGSGGSDVRRNSIPGPGHVNGSYPMLRQPYEFSHRENKVGEDSSLDNHGLSFRSNSNLPYESCPFGSIPDMVPRTQPFHHPSLVNVSSMNNSSLSKLTFPMEPPSSQSYCSSYSPLWSDEEKMMVGMKRPCPFPLDNPPIPTFNDKFAPNALHPTNRPQDESTPCGNRGTTTFSFDATIPIFREVPSCPSAIPHEPASSKMTNGSENGNSNGGFLTLAPTTVTTPQFPSSKLKQTSALLASHSRDLFSSESLLHQNSKGSNEGLASDSGQGGSSQQPNFFTFLPSTTKVRVASTSSSGGQNSSDGEVGENVDLNLRL